VKVHRSLVKVHWSPVKVQRKSTGLLPDTLVHPLSWPKGSLTGLLSDFYQTLSGLSLDLHQTPVDFYQTHQSPAGQCGGV